MCGANHEDGCQLWSIVHDVSFKVRGNSKRLKLP